MKIILASDSPRRKELLRKSGVAFSVVSFPTRERSFSRRPAYTVRSNAEKKAWRAARSHPQALIISADTVVYLDKILGKPENLAEARRMLKLLSGKTHRVYTAIALLLPPDNVKITEVAVTRVKMKKLDRQIIGRYLSRVNPLDKAGAYAVQEEGEMLIEKISGSLSNVIGLPLESLEEALKMLLKVIPSVRGLNSARKKILTASKQVRWSPKKGVYFGS